MFANQLPSRLAAASFVFTLLATSAVADVSVEKQGTSWQVIANQEPVTGVLSALGKQAGIKIAGTRKLISDPQISGSWDGSIDVVLSRILRGVDYVTETGVNSDGTLRITRLIVLSGEVGQEPSTRAVRTARKLQNLPTAAETAQAKEDGQRVTSLLDNKARVIAGLPNTTGSSGQSLEQDNSAGGGGGITRNEDGTFDIDPQTQARMAEATRRAQADLQALVNALRQSESNSAD